MMRFIYVIIRNVHRIWMIPTMGYYAKHKEKYSEQFRYQYDLKAIRQIMISGRIYTIGYGQEHLPVKGGYVMFCNHQGKYDALGIMHTHATPCSVVMDEKRSHTPLVQQFIDLVQGKRIRLDDLRQAAGVISEVTREVKQGRRFIIFPSGGYKHRNGNHVDPFKPGCFKSAMRAHAPIVPVALVDSWKVFDLWSMRRVETQVIYLRPLYYEDYQGMKSTEVSDIVYARIKKAISLAEAGLPEEAKEC